MNRKMPWLTIVSALLLAHCSPAQIRPSGTDDDSCSSDCAEVTPAPSSGPSLLPQDSARCENSPGICGANARCDDGDGVLKCLSACPDNTFGTQCSPCSCANGTCDSGPTGTGDCRCDGLWAGERCDVCPQSWSTLETLIDPLAQALLIDEKFPGLSLAVSQHGRLLFTKGYGFANTQTQQAMRYDMRAKIGSVSKVIATGPAGFDLLKSLDMSPEQSALYGPGSIFENAYEEELANAAARYTPIVGLAIHPDGASYVWYADNTLSWGSPEDLDAYGGPIPFSLPTGKKAVDIRAMGIAADGDVYTWYDDRSRSIGIPTKLDAYSGEDAPKVSLPPGKSILHVLGAAIEKTNDRIYVWYEDGTRSVGTSLDFDSETSPESFSTPSDQNAYRIRGFGLSGDGKTRAWYTNNMVSSGVSRNLDFHEMQTSYSFANSNGTSPNWKTWSESITIQNLLDHRAGFTRSGDGDGTKAMFNVSEEEKTYAQVHAHFLSTRKLLSAPGELYAYSNHGFGMWTIIIEALSQKTFRNYVRENYLTPQGLENLIVPQAQNSAIDDVAQPHVYVNGVPIPVPFKDSTLGLAAGGYTASAMGLLRAMGQQRDKFTDAELDQLGWAKDHRAKLSHNGKTSDGAAFAVMFPSGFISTEGPDLSEISVAVITNVGGSTSALSDLSNAIARIVGSATIAECDDQWAAMGIN